MRLPTFVMFSIAQLLFIACTQRLSGHDTHPVDMTSKAEHDHSSSMTPAPRPPSLLVIDEPTERVMTVRVGPVNLPALTQHWRLPQVFFTIPFDGWLMSFRPRLIDAKGNSLPDRLIHHVEFFNTTRRDLLCPEEMEVMFSTGRELQQWQYPSGTGYRVQKGDDILIGLMVENQTDRSFQESYLEVIMIYTSYSEQLLWKNAYPMIFSVLHCKKGLSVYDLKPGFNLARTDIEVPHSGRLLAVGGHMHDYARGLKLENVTRREEIVVFEPKLDDQGRFLSLPVISLTERGGYKIERGDTLRLTSIYHNPTGNVLSEAAMGSMVGAFLPDNEEELPSGTSIGP